MASYDVSRSEIRDYWQTWYYEYYGISSYYFDLFYIGNGVF